LNYENKLCILANGHTACHRTGNISKSATCTEPPVQFIQSFKYGLSDGVTLSGIIAPFPKFLSLFLRRCYV